jgi:hypothetical protein
LPLPVNIEESINAMSLSDDEIIAEVLGNQIDDQLAVFRQSIEVEKSQARHLLQQLPPRGITDGDQYRVDVLRKKIAQVARGASRLTEDIQKEVSDVIRKLDDDKARVAASEVARALSDLGYEVEPIRDTLYLEGGMVHFRSNDLGDGYYFRMRISPNDRKMNVNVVRTGEAVSDKADVQAENNWCNQAPKIEEVFRGRGVLISLKRQLAAGELPVQKIDSGSIDQDYWKKKHSVRKSMQQVAEPKKRYLR